jgi:hypothetical protein
MSFLLHPLQVFAAMLNERVRHEQEKMIEFLRAETEVLLEQLGDKRILLSDDERRLLAVKGMALEKEDLEKFCAIVQPDTIRRWHRELVEGNRYKNPQRKTGRPATEQEVVELVLRMARENPSWGYKRIEGALSNVGYSICSSTVANILKHHGVEPAPQRKRQLSWGTFIKAHWDAFEGVDLSMVFGQLIAAVFACLTSLTVTIGDAWSESKWPMDGQVPAGDAAINRISEAENFEIVSCEAVSIKSLQFTRVTRGPPSLCDGFKSSSSDVLAKAA